MYEGVLISVPLSRVCVPSEMASMDGSVMLLTAHLTFDNIEIGKWMSV